MKKMITLLAILSTVLKSNAQPIPDSALLDMSEQDLGLHFLHTSRNQKTAGYVLAGIAVASYIALPFVFTIELDRSLEGEEVSGTGSIAISIVALGSTAASIGFISLGTKYTGKAEMLLRTKSANEPPGYELAMGMQYQRKAMRQRIIGFGLLASGVTMMVIAPDFYAPEKGDYSHIASNVVAVGGMAVTCASLPFLLSATKNNGRASVLLKKEIIPFSYYSRPIGLNSVVLSIALGK